MITLSATAAVMAVHSRYDREIVPCTNRSHLVVYSHQEERRLGEAAFAEEMVKRGIVDKRDPRSIRVRLIVERIITAAHRGLGLDDDGNDAPMLRVTAEKWGKTTWPHTSHLRGLNWEVILVRDDETSVEIAPGGKILVFTGLLDLFKTDDEIAAVLAHEVTTLLL
jgi:predicted Zn-dependent protease